MNQSKKCPVCGQNDLTGKVSTIYLLGISQDSKRPLQALEDGATPALKTPAWLTEYSKAELRSLSRRLAPPAGGKEIPIRAIHPDLVVLVFSLVAPIFLYGILSSQSGMLAPVLLILAGFYGLYFWMRKSVISRFEREQASQKAKAERIKRGIERWMVLHYCAREDVIFELPSREAIPADQMPGYLLKA